MNRMTELLERINYDLPGLKKAKMCYAQGDADGAMDAVIEHFRTRTTPKYLFTAKEMEQCKVDGILEDAQETLDHYIYGHKFDGEIDWFFNPTEHTSHDNEWTWSLYRHIYWQPLARAYALTKDEKYTKEFLHEMTEWGKAWPVTPFMENEEDAAAKYKFPGHSWRTIETAMRIYTVWLPCMEAFRTSPAWDREGWVTFLTLLCDHADFLMTHYSNHKKSSNWLTMESGTLLECGILFPEIKSDWFMTGYRRVMQEVKYSFDNDGIHMERTPIYHMVAAGVYFQCYRLCKLNGIPVPPYMEPTLEKSAQFIMSLVKPDLSTPMIGDADRDDLTTRRCDAIFKFGPMFGLYISFIDYKPARGIFGSKFVGLKWFKSFFSDYYFGRLLINTVRIAVADLLTFPLPVILALLINELKNKKFSKTAQTLLYVPHFISTVVICGIVITLTSSTGAITEVLHNFFGIKEQALLNNPSNFLPIYILTELWQTLGWNSIIYLSALSGIDQELYDAAKVDGANRWQQCLHVTLPGIAPTIVIMLILKMGKIFNVGYERVMLLYNPAIYNTADVINTYVYRKGLIDAQFSYSTAVGMFNCLVSFALVMITNKISQKVNGSGLW